MATISVFEIFKIGVGPSSSHTLGPWRAALSFTADLSDSPFDEIEVHLYGSLSKTGKGHATDKALVLGLSGYDPSNIDTAKIPSILEQIAENDHTVMAGNTSICFDIERDIHFHKHEKRTHPNTMTFKARFKGKKVLEKTYYSVGGGFIQEEGLAIATEEQSLPHLIETGADLIRHVEKEGLRISDIVMQNELALLGEQAIHRQLDLLYSTMKTCVYSGCLPVGFLPGGLKVKRRAKAMCEELLGGRTFSNQAEWEMLIRESIPDFKSVNQWVSCFALAVNEENAAMGRVVTSPTNGAAGVIPAVMLYLEFFGKAPDKHWHRAFLCTAGEIGSLFKKGATISAAVGGCQAEIGVSSAMAAGGLTEALGGSPEQVLMAAEIAMEHHLGMTCDPIGGLVQVPCIERNAMGAIKAITACHLALSSDPEHGKVHFDMVIKTMWDTAQAMNKKYKETSEGGLAYNIPVIIPEC